MEESKRTPVKTALKLAFIVLFLSLLLLIWKTSEAKGEEIMEFIDIYYALGQEWKENGGDERSAEYILSVEEKLLTVEMIVENNTVDTITHQFEHYNPRMLFLKEFTLEKSKRVDYRGYMLVVSDLMSAVPFEK